MTSPLHLALEKLDGKIDQLEIALEAFLRQKPAVESEAEPTGDKAEALAKLDGIIGKLETILKA
jgi:hypothetical protein